MNNALHSQAGEAIAFVTNQHVLELNPDPSLISITHWTPQLTGPFGEFITLSLILLEGIDVKNNPYCYLQV